MASRSKVETNLATVSVSNTPVDVMGETITLNYYTASRAITVMFNGYTTLAERLPYLTALSEDREKGDNKHPGPYIVKAEFGDFDKFSHRDLIDFRNAILNVTYRIPKAHSDFRDNTMRRAFNTPKMQLLNLEKFPPQLGLPK